ncbi:MAG: pyridinium-3,5-biscarboxylic acid mononucleotide sulfurtransferase [Frankiales bacterium]|nr:pyridinium-3,5-biscarboxylic acid mononucleotide sulfurtransferase [Frankiales bacterium]
MFTVGFDLDMTLIDSRPGVKAAMDGLSERMGVHIDTDLVITRLGPPLERELARWFPSWEIEAAAALYRELYGTTCLTGTTAMPGAHAAFEAVRAAGGKVIVVTAKSTPLAKLCLDTVGLHPDAIEGWLFSAGKGEALLEHGASIYVGDHIGDIEGAKFANALPVAVATGPIAADVLADAGASVVLSSLEEFGPWLEHHLDNRARVAELEARLRDLGSVAVAFSGGADSAFLLAAAVRALGSEQVVAVTAVSPSLADGELDQAAAFARDLGVRHETVTTDELARDGYRANQGDRCYHCKSELLDTLLPVARGHGMAHVLTGTNADDVAGGFRPGITAAAERGALTPLADAGLTKRAIRTVSKQWGLATWAKPAAACLSSRVAYGIEITPARLARVDRAESALRSALAGAGIPVQNLRVRDLGDVARVEIDAQFVPEVTGDLLAAVEGFSTVELDPVGFRSGSMNELLADPERYR